MDFLNKSIASCNWQPVEQTGWRIDLQLFNQEKTEEATPKRREEARQKGQVARSNEVNSAFIILASFMTLRVAAPYMYEQMTALMRYIFSDFLLQPLTADTFQQLFLFLADRPHHHPVLRRDRAALENLAGPEESANDQSAAEKIYLQP